MSSPMLSQPCRKMRQINDACRVRPSSHEAFNHPIWIRYYGKPFGHKHLFVIDRDSRLDESTEILVR